MFSVCSMILAAILSEPLVVCQTQFYPTREQDRGYLGRYPDQPLLVIPDLPPAAHEIKSSRKRALWGDYTSMADIDFMFAQGRDYGLDGFAFFPVRHRNDLWNAQESSVAGVALTPIINFSGLAGVAFERDIEQLERAIRNTRGPKVDGKTLVLSYWCDRANTPEKLKQKLDAARAKVGDRFAFMTAVAWDKGLFDYRQTGKMSDEMAARLAEHWRGYLRVSDGILLDGTMSNHAITNSTRVFCDGWHREVCLLARKVVDEPEFKDRKLLGFTLSLGHQNAYHQSYTANAMGTRTLRQSFSNVIAAQPDVVLVPEWDELNESTSWKPTLYNGYTTKRLYRYFNAVLRHRPQTVMEGDDTSVPNLMVSYRRLCAPGEWLYFEVLNVPDGARDGTVEVSLELTDAAGETIAELPAKTLSEGRLDEAWWDVRSEELAARSRVVGVRLKWRKGFFRRGTVAEGLTPIDLAPANSWCLKDVKQALRDLAPVSDASFVREPDGRLSAAVACDEEILHAMLVGNGWIQYVHNPADAVSRFRTDEAAAVFALNAYRPKTDDPGKKVFSFAVRGVPEAEWLCVNECTTGEVFRTDFLSASGNPVYLRVPRSRLGGAKAVADFGTHGRGELDLAAADRLGAVASGAADGVSFTAARFDLQPRYPKPLRRKTAAFTVMPSADRGSTAYHLQLVTVSGKTWRSKPIVVEKPGDPVRTRVWSALDQRAVDCVLPSSRVPRLVYDFSPEAGDVVRPRNGERHFFGLLGAPQSLVTLWDRGAQASGPLEFSSVPKDAAATADWRPTRERLPGGRWALRFDGVDDHVSFPHETVPQWAGSVATFEINQDPAGTNRIETVFSSRSGNRCGLFDLILDKGEPIVRCQSADVLATDVLTEIRSGVKIAPGLWHVVFVWNDGEKLVLTVDGKSVAKPLPMPGIFMNTAILGGAVQNGTSFFTGRVRTLDVNHGVCNVADEWVRGADGTGVYACAALPAKGVRRPTVVSRSPYIRNPDGSEATNRVSAAFVSAFDSPEYTKVLQHCRGRGASEGVFVPYADERADGLALLDWVRKLPSYDGRIFLSGGSYGASVHFAYLGANPPDVVGACLTVQDCRRYNIRFRNGFFKAGLHGEWFKNNYRNKVPGRVKDETVALSDFPLIDWSRRFFGAAEPAFDTPLLHPRADDPFWSGDDPSAGRDYGEALAKSTMPVLLRTGFYDIYTEGVFDMWRSMSPERRSNCALIVDAYDHGGEVAEAMRGSPGEFPDGGRSHFGQAEDEWRDWCFGTRASTFTGFEKGKTTYYALWENKWYTEPELRDGPRKVALPLATAPAEVAYDYDPRRELPKFPGSGGICFGGMRRQPEPNFREDVKSFLLPPIRERLDVRGRMTARLAVKSDCEDTCFYIRVSVRKEDGKWYLLRDDITSLCHDQGPYVPGTARTLDYRFPDHAFRLEPGDVLRVDVSSASSAFAPHPNVSGNPNLCRTPKVAHNVVLPHESSLVLPVKEDRPGLAAVVCPGELNVKDFGAVGDGRADDTAAVEKAIEASQSHDFARRSPRGTMGENDGPHQAVVFPRGTYRLTSTVFTGRDAHLRGLPGSVIEMSRADRDIFFFHTGTRVRVEGLRFKGGRHQLNLATLNRENANFHVRNCTFEAAASNAINSISRITAKREPVNEFVPDGKGGFCRDARFDGAAGYNNSTFFLIEDSFFDRCAHAVEFHSDGGVVRNCRVIHPATSSGAPFVGTELSASASIEAHYYNLDVLVERNGKDDQSFFDLHRGTHVIAIDDSTFRTSDGSGIPLFDSRSACPYFFSSYIVRNCEVACGGRTGQGVVRLHPGAAPQIVAFENVRETSGKPVEVFEPRGKLDEAWLHEALDRFDSAKVSLEQRYSFAFRGCSPNVSTDLGPLLGRFVKPFPDDLPKELFPRRPVGPFDGPVLFAGDFGVAADGKTDDAAAMQRLADALAQREGSVGVLPPEWILLSRPVLLNGKVALVGAGTTAFRQADDSTAFFRVGNGATVKLQNLVFQDGRHVVTYAADVARPTRVEVDGCFAFNSVRWDKFGGAMFQFAAKENPAAVELRVTGGSYYAPVLYRGNARTFLDGFWFRCLPRTAEKDDTWSTAIVNEKGGRMRAADILGVPIALMHKGQSARNDSTVPCGDFRWFDNHGVLHAEHFRFGGEYGGLVPVYAYGDAETYICGQFGEFKTFCCRQTPVCSDSDAAESVLFSTLSISRPLLPDQKKRIRFENALWLRQ